MAQKSESYVKRRYAVEWQGVTSNRKGNAWKSNEKLREAMAELRGEMPCNGLARRSGAVELLRDVWPRKGME